MIRIVAIACFHVVFVAALAGQAVRPFDVLPPVGPPLNKAITNVIKTADVDNDGDLDVFAGRLFLSSVPNALYLNDGRGVMTEASASQFPRAIFQVFGIAAEDFDGDGDLDAIFASARGLTFYENVGKPKFREASVGRFPNLTTLASSLASSDVDGDGDVDVVLGGTAVVGYLNVLINDGKGRFSVGGTVPQPKLQATPVLVDLDADGDLDIVVKSTLQVSLYIQVRPLVWQDESVKRWKSTASRLARTDVVDVDRDGDMDIVAQPLKSRTVLLLLNDGTGNFRDAPAGSLPANPGEPRQFVGSDVDLDGDTDLFVVNGAAQMRLWINDGKSRFRDVTSSHVPKSFSHAIAAEDFDRDGDIDIYAAGGVGDARFAPDALIVNRDRQIHASKGPRLGQAWVLDAYFKPGSASSTAMFVSYVSLQKLTSRVRIAPYGWLAVPPISSVALKAIAIPNGVASQPLSIPNQSVLRNKIAYVQGLVFPSARLAEARLTNLWFDQIR